MIELSLTVTVQVLDEQALREEAVRRLSEQFPDSPDMVQSGSAELPAALTNAVSALRLIEGVPGVRLVGSGVTAGPSASSAPVLPRRR